MGLPKNPCAKTRKVNDPYEIWVAGPYDYSTTGLPLIHYQWEWRVLKKYQSPENEAKNEYARWFCAVKGPGTFVGYDMGDTYVKDIITHGSLLSPSRRTEYLKTNQWHEY